ncbi:MULTISPECIES: hypothetical protein [Paeniglutamicibacter]|uniref:Uncharacterized protein n=1 Tax=Paeniglutamicibacter sulfureus TaxID=43666 RepID=A0ABU2BFK0_9MICC|nr:MULTISPECIES: hypothetical protein [Paeniglutamicibacter]MCV9992830.1 hypothetical protein [Paeniglutamicibacter sp. ZC-3]MDO2933114.1 hypothetical protein [Paeniglutamicibacter sulfureus]MDR7357412.1 hypothetical protein [Paeniglutamicibacter sulfureus]
MDTIIWLGLPRRETGFAESMRVIGIRVAGAVDRKPKPASLKMNSINAERMKVTTHTESSCARKSCKFSMDCLLFAGRILGGQLGKVCRPWTVAFS